MTDDRRARAVAYAILRSLYPHMPDERFAGSWKISDDDWRWKYLPQAHAAIAALDAYDRVEREMKETA